VTDGDALLAAIKAHSDDDNPRLAYADCLDDLMTPEATSRAAFIRKQIELARHSCGSLPPTHPHFQGPHCERCIEAVVLRHEVSELLTAHGRTWVSPLVHAMKGNNGQFMQWDAEHVEYHSTRHVRWEWRRGFIESMSLSAADWLRGADTITTNHPVRRVKLTTIPTNIQYGDPQDPVIMRFPGREWRAVGRYDGPQGSRRRLERLFAAEWEGITFELPLIPLTLAEPGLTPRPDRGDHYAVQLDVVVAPQAQVERHVFVVPGGVPLAIAVSGNAEPLRITAVDREGVVVSTLAITAGGGTLVGVRLPGEGAELLMLSNPGATPATVRVRATWSEPAPPLEQTILWSIEIARQAGIGDGFVRPGRPQGRLSGVLRGSTNYFRRGQVIGPLAARSRDGGHWVIPRAVVTNVRHSESPNIIIDTVVDAVADGMFTRQDDTQ
jgi:uncharacterized protein (TIGR02996 family)